MNTRIAKDWLLAILAVVIIMPMLLSYFGLMPDNRVAVEIYKSTETGEMIYCETGDLSNSSGHTYMGSGRIDRAKAEAC